MARIRLPRPVLFVVFLLLFFIFGSVVWPSGAAAVSNQSLAVPLFARPNQGSFWQDIRSSGKDTVPFVVANPLEGPGRSADPIFTDAIAKNNASGIRTIGYVQTNYQARPIKEVLSDIDAWQRFYPGVKGIYINLIKEGSDKDLCYTAALYSHVKNTRPNDLVVLNPATHISSAFEPYGDIFVTAMMDYATYRSWQPMYRGFEDKEQNQNRFWHMVYGVSSDDYSSAFALLRANNAGWVYVTDKSAPMPFVETPIHWSLETSDISALPASAIPNRGKTALPRGCISFGVSADSTVDTTVSRQTTVTAVTKVSNISEYDAEPTSKAQLLTLPKGASLTALSGTGWQCDVNGKTCTNTSVVPANSSIVPLVATVKTGCDYEGGDAVVRISNYAGNQWDVKLPLGVPVGCDPTSAAGKINKDTVGQVTVFTTQGVETTPAITPLSSQGAKKDELPPSKTSQGPSGLKIVIITTLLIVIVGGTAGLFIFLHYKNRYKVDL